MADKDNPMEKWLQAFPPPSASEREDSGKKNESESGKSERFPAQLDLHGMTREEASSRLLDFIGNSVRAGLRKVLVIHGRGLGSQGAAVLPALVREELEKNPHVIDFGPAAPAQGGAGAMRVFLKQDRRFSVRGR
ncbi:MAG: Smr/MutS family protein [Spirochaetales bacterium]|jgi:DNA-nicking Smr family endonuclease|nr:Smr/MutS family protein [Spirochaetales bacterium]